MSVIHDVRKRKERLSFSCTVPLDDSFVIASAVVIPGKQAAHVAQDSPLYGGFEARPTTIKKIKVRNPDTGDSVKLDHRAFKHVRRCVLDAWYADREAETWPEVTAGRGGVA